MKEIGKIIRERRKSLRVNQLELSELAGVGINTLVAIERGEGNPKLKTLLPSKLVYRKMSFSVQPNASKPTTVDKYIFTAVGSANYGTATG